jgi:hypothetical protein
MPSLVKILAASTAVLAVGLGTLAATQNAQAHPHNKKIVIKKMDKSADNSSIEQETDYLTDKDIEAHFERHKKALEKSMDKAKIRSRIMRRSLGDSEEETEQNDASAKQERKITKRIRIIENPKELRDTARSLQNMLSESGIIEELADIVIELAEDIEIEETGGGMRLSFDGKRIGGFSMDEDNNSLSIESLGGNTTIEKETFMENGKKKTRIIIETDSDSTEFDIVPKRKRKSGF